MNGTTATEAQTPASRPAPRVEPLKIYITGLAAVAFVLFLVLAYLQLTWAVLPPLSAALLLFFSAVAVCADYFTVRIDEKMEVSAGFLAYFLSGVVLGPLAAMIVAVVSLGPTYRRGAWQRNVCFAAVLALASGLGALVFWLIRAERGGGLESLLLGGLLGSALFQAVNYLLFVPVMHWRRGLAPKAYFREGFLPVLPFHLFFLAVSLGLLYSFSLLRSAGIVLFSLPVAGLVYAFRSYARQRELARSLERFSLQMAGSMITALDLKDDYTAQHSAAVAQYAYDIARAYGLSEKECNLAHLAGLLHDLGKISVPDEILNARRRLDDDEWEIVQAHTTAGQRILSNMSEFEDLGRVVLHHHERFDGNGYPHGLQGEEIPLLSRIVSVADCYSAMISSRPYSAKRPPEVAMMELRDQRGLQFDPQVVGVFLGILEKGDLAYRSAQHVDFHVQFQKVRFLRDIM